MKTLLSIITIFFGISSANAMNITAKTWLVADETGQIIQSSNIDRRQSIASITKLMTALVVLDAAQNLDERIGKYTRRQNLHLALVHSDNAAAKRLCVHYPRGNNACIRAMNDKAQQLGMMETHYVEPTGLNAQNVSTALDLVKLVLAAKEYPDVVQSSKMPVVKIRRKKRLLVFRNTNPIIGQRHEFLVSKTGYIRASGGCIVMLVNTEIGRRIVVLLGSKNTRTRIPEAEFIARNY